MSSQTVIFTALPQRVVDANTVRLAVHVAPRLTPGGATGFLSDFPDFEHWASADIGFGVSFNGAEVIFNASIVTDPARDADRWDELFAPPVGVKGKAFPNYWNLPVLSYPAKKVVDYLTNAYAEMGVQSPGQPPSIGDLAQHFDSIGFTDEPDEKDPRTGVLGQLQNEVETKKYNEYAASSTAADFLSVQRFFKRPGKKVPIVTPNFDFHEEVALLASYPWLLRKLGLVFDIEVSARALGLLPQNSEVQLHVQWTPELADTKIVLPRTACEVNVNAGVFRARPRDPNELLRGQLRIGNGSYDLLTIDPDGAGLKALNFASTLKRSKMAKHKTEDTPTHAAPPSLRSAGIALLKSERSKSFHLSLVVGKGLNDDVVAGAAPIPDPAVQPLVYAEDVTRGYAVDIWSSEANQWRSVMRRAGHATFTSSNTSLDAPADDESTLTTAPALPADPTAKQELYLQQTLFQWFGWSLGIKPPGTPIQKNDTLVDPDAPGESPLPIAFEFSVPQGSLPRLRYGVEYGVRVRAVDIAGGSVAIADGAPISDPDLVLKDLYLRSEPLNSPEVALRNSRTEGESVRRLVVRSDFTGPIQQPGERHIVPPKTAQLTAEQHGKFDTPTKLDVNAYDLIANHEAKNLSDAGGIVDAEDPGNFRIPVAQVVLPYLPDPMIRGAAIRNLPGTDGSVRVYDFNPSPGTVWPEFRPFRIVVVQAAANGGLGPAAEPVFDASNRTLTIELPKAWVVRLRLSSAPVQALINLLEMWKHMKAAVPPPDLAALTAAVENGAHWLTSPDGELMLVHAVRRPLKTPEWVNPNVVRALGQTFATIVDREFTFSRKSTGKVEVFGTWPECIDEGPGTVPTQITVNDSAAFVVPIVRDPKNPPDFEHDILDVQDRHQFGDTKHRDITYKAIATTKFGEYFVKRETHPSGGAFTLGDGTAVLPESVTVKDETGHTYARDTDYTVSGATITPVAIPADHMLTVSYLTPPITQTTQTPRLMKILSSARPPAPKVLYVVPTFRWPRANPLASTRQGAGVRVYLERPWNASGCGELLGVTLWKGPDEVLQFDPPQQLWPYVTRWGHDPIFGGGTLPVRNPTFAQFPLSTAAMHGEDKSLDEIDAHVHVAGHPVAYDATRDLWYCDINIDPIGTAYMPFIRLALSRFQPDSLEDAHLSRVVLADFIQLAPDRALTVAPVPGRNQKYQYTVTLAGVTYTSTEAGASGGTARVIVEQRDTDKGTADELGWSAKGKAVELTRQSPLNSVVGVWTGTVDLPGQPTPGKFRLVVEQFEQIPVGHALIGNGLVNAPRLVYSDIVPL